MSEAIVDAKKIDKLPLLIFKFNRTSDFIAVPQDIPFPAEVSFITLLDGTKVALLDAVIEHQEWWVIEKL
jgi:hypothetical protein